MAPLLVLLLGLVLLVAGWLVLRSVGPRVRIGRLLAATPRVSVDQARQIATSDRPRYVRVDGRLDSDEEFEDRDHRPLVLRRTRLQAQTRRGWETFEDNREQVAFEIREGLAGIAIDGESLADGLVVVPRESRGTVADLGDRAPAGMAPETAIRARIEQVSSVEHAIALGVPETSPGGIRLTAGLGRPLVLSTLEPREAMRILAEGATGRTRAAAALLGTGVAVAIVGLAWLILDAVT